MYDFADVFEELFGISFDIFETAGSMLIFNNVLAVILGIGLVVLAYVVASYALMFQGRKSGLTNDWFAYIPIARSIYKLDIVGEDRWKIIFIGGLAGVIKLILILILIFFIFATNAVVSIIFELIVLVYFGFSVYFNYLFNRKFYRLFNFNEHLALVNLAADISVIYLITAVFGGFITVYFFIGSVCIISSLSAAYMGVFECITAFDNRCQIVGLSDQGYNYQSQDIRPNRGKIVCTAGMYKDAEFQVENDFEIIIGRDSYFSSIVITENSTSVSRKHCGIRYDSATGNYIVTDYSSNGTYTGDGQRLPRNVSQNLPAGTSIYLGDKVNRFKLM
ncbi:MAG: FHA domain-containing protein [Lachnospirales bacterium]